jgi:hypothetical protein
MKRCCTLGLLSCLAAFSVAVSAAPRESVSAVIADAPPKPSGPIDLSYRLTSLPVAGQPLDVEVTARGADVEGLVLEAAVANDAGLVIAAQTPGVDVEGGRRWIVTVIPSAADTAYLTVVATGSIDALVHSRSIVVPIRTAPALRGVAKQVAAISPEGERLILLPAEEFAPPAR